MIIATIIGKLRDIIIKRWYIMKCVWVISDWRFYGDCEYSRWEKLHLRKPINANDGHWQRD